MNHVDTVLELFASNYDSLSSALHKAGGNPSHVLNYSGGLELLIVLAKNNISLKAIFEGAVDG